MDETLDIIQKFREKTDSDVIIINAPIDSDFISLIDEIDQYPTKRDNVSVFLTTYGGSADLAFSFAKTLQTCYTGKFVIYITSYCKSAGTLIALGAHEIVFSNSGELGPLDVQTYKPDEFFNVSSGLDIIEALRAIMSHSYIAYQSFFYPMILDGKGTITTQTAGLLSIQLTRNFIEPIAQQIDPLQLGEMHRKIRISEEYGKRPSENLPYTNRERVVENLTRNYPSHGFVIDYDKSRKLLEDECVRKVDKKEERLLCGLLYEQLRFPLDSKNSYIRYINDDFFKLEEPNIEGEHFSCDNVVDESVTNDKDAKSTDVGTKKKDNSSQKDKRG